jgi:hypothetical protein
MKIISIFQPWAWAIVAHEKTVANRTGEAFFRFQGGPKVPFRGPILIHADKSRKLVSVGREDFSRWHGVDVDPEELVFGAVIGIAELVDCVRIVEGLPATSRALCVLQNPFAVGPFCWILARRRRFQSPIFCAGRLGLFDLPVAGMLREEIESPRSRPAPRACMWCGWTDRWSCDEPHEWVGDELCSQCAELIGQDAAGAGAAG